MTAPTAAGAWRPGPREAAGTAAAVFFVALAARLWAASQVTFPAPEDTAYYVGVARNLLDGRGLVSDALWSYATPPLQLPRPAFEVWLPLPTFLAAIPMALLGSSFAAAQWSPMLVGAIACVLAWRLAADVAADRGLPIGRARTLALGTGLASAVYLPLVLHSALPDSTMPFTALALAACLLMARLLRPAASRHRRRDLVLLGAVLGISALARNEAAWLAIAWVALAWRRRAPRQERVQDVALVGVVAAAIFSPWAVRDWLAFGSPLPGQAVLNALSLGGRDIFAWQDRPSLARYVAAGPAFWLTSRVTGTAHNVFDVLLVPGAPMAPIGLFGLPLASRLPASQPLVVVAAITFAVASLVFPVSTTWGTFLHAAGPVHVLLLLGCLLVLDRGIAWVGGRRGWTRPVAWLGPLLAGGAGVLFTASLLPAFGTDGREVATKFAQLRALLEGGPIAAAADGGPVITDFPIWLAEETGRPSLALPNEPPPSVLDLAGRFPRTGLLIVDAGAEAEGALWPAILSAGGPAAACFQPIAIPAPTDPAAIRAMARTRLYRIACP